MDYIGKIRQGFETSFIDSNLASDISYRSQFVSNNYKEGKKVLSSIEDELLVCDEFQISVAFITMGGITPLLQTLKELENKGIPGKILTTNYLCFSEPRALKKLHELSNIELKMYDAELAEDGFHTKGYIFKKEEIYRIIIGSSNMTKSALTTNHEWNTKIVSTDEGEMTREILSEFNELWNSDYTLDFDDFYERYQVRYSIIQAQHAVALSERNISIEKYNLKPNSMQENFIANLEILRSKDARKALLISATGTGKTYASAFAMRKLGFKRVLFLAHRETLIKQSMRSYQNVLSNDVSMGLLGGGNSDFESDYIFGTVQTVGKEDNLNRFEKDAFDCIIIDEAHHSPAGTYQRIVNHFEPKLWLGMTATPDKRDDYIEGRNVYELFDHNIAYEIRLQQAMEEDLLCPFHYFGITEIAVINEDEVKNKKISDRNFKKLTSDERIKHIVEQANYYGYSGDRVKGLIFCSRIDEAQELSRKLNMTINPETGACYRTIALSGATSPDDRQKAFKRLAEGTDDDALDYIISVDLLNEGVDIVEVNQVIMLRPTQSPIIFIQQLGRGLRKAKGKEYVVVLDFIGNYKNNFMIPIALSGDRSYNKDTIRRYVREGMRVIPGASTVHFDEVARKEIFSSIDKANFNSIALIKENYITLKNKLGHIPALRDFDRYGEMDVTCIFDSTAGSYYNFLVKYDDDYKIRLNEDEARYIEFVSRKLAQGKRVHELEMIDRILHYSDGIMRLWRESMKTKYGIIPSDAAEDNVVNIMTNEFPTSAAKKTFDKCIFIEADASNEDYMVPDKLRTMLKNSDFRNILSELVEFGIHRYRTNYSNRYKDSDLVLYQKYTYEDVCRILNWEHNEVPLNIGGYKYDKKTKTFPVFINYMKDEDISATTKYEDRFIDHHKLIAISKAGKRITSNDVQNFLYADERGIQVELFVRKNKDDKISKEFYYLGRMTATGMAKEFVMPGTDKSAVEIEWELDTPVREDIYDYIIS